MDLMELLIAIIFILLFFLSLMCSLVIPILLLILAIKGFIWAWLILTLWVLGYIVSKIIKEIKK